MSTKQGDYGVPTEFVPVKDDAGDLATHKEFMEESATRSIRPAKWSFTEVVDRLNELARDDQWNGDTRYVSLKSTDSPNCSTIPGMWVTVHLLKPGEKISMHRHTPSSCYYIIKGTGYSTVNDYRIDWATGDTFSCPSWSYHEHFNTGDEDVLMWTVQDSPLYTYGRMMLFQPGGKPARFLHKT